MIRRAHIREHDPPPAGRRGARPVAGGFSLMEVLMAAFVMGLGVLGLTALFAGAARQQQLASQQTRSWLMSQSAEAMLADRLAPVGVMNGGCQNPAPEPAHPCADLAALDNILPGVWYPVPMEDLPGGAAQANAGAFLTLNPTDTSWFDGDLFFRMEPTEELPKLLYRAAWQPGGGGAMPVGFAGADSTTTPPYAPQLGLPPFTSGAPAWNGALGAVRVLMDSMKLRIVTRSHPVEGERRRVDVVDEREFLVTGESWQCGDPFLAIGSVADPTGFAFVFVQPEDTASDDELLSTSGVVTQMYVGDVDPFVGTGSYQLDLTLASQISGVEAGDELPVYRQVPTGGQPLYTANPIGTGEISVAPTSGGPPGTYSFDASTPGDPDDLVLNIPPGGYYVELPSGTGGDYTLTDTGLPAGISVERTRVPERYVHEVWIEEYLVRGSKLVSGTDRVTRDSSGRPSMAYTMLFRTTEEGTTQFAVMSYAVSPASGDAEEFLPPERCADYDNDEAPLRLVELTLRYDDDLDKYFVQPRDDSADGWVIEPGQVLLFSGDLVSSGNPDDDVPGADGGVTIQFVRDDTDGKPRGYLDVPPRAGLETLMAIGSPNNDPFSMVGVALDAWAIQSTAESVADGSFWNLEPIGVSVLREVE